MQYLARPAMQRGKQPMAHAQGLPDRSTSSADVLRKSSCGPRSTTMRSLCDAAERSEPASRDCDTICRGRPGANPPYTRFETRAVLSLAATPLSNDRETLMSPSPRACERTGRIEEVSRSRAPVAILRCETVHILRKHSGCGRPCILRRDPSAMQRSEPATDRNAVLAPRRCGANRPLW